MLRIHEEAEGLDFSFFRGELPRETLITSEIELLNSLFDNNDLIVQRPIKNKENQYLTRLNNGTIATVLSWINGDTLYRKELPEPLVYRIGEMVAALHKATCSLPHLNRCVYDDVAADLFLSEIQAAKDLKHIENSICEKFVTIINKTKKYYQSKKTTSSLYIPI